MSVTTIQYSVVCPRSLTPLESEMDTVLFVASASLSLSEADYLQTTSTATKRVIGARIAHMVERPTEQPGAVLM